MEEKRYGAMLVSELSSKVKINLKVYLPLNIPDVCNIKNNQTHYNLFVLLIRKFKSSADFVVLRGRSDISLSAAYARESSLIVGIAAGGRFRNSKWC